MTLYKFNLLNEAEQYDTVFTKGTFLDSKNYGAKRFALYAIDRFFVEVEYDAPNNKIVGLKSFKTGALLDKYSNINL